MVEAGRVGPESDLAEIGELALASSTLGLEAWLRLSLSCEMLVPHKARPPGLAQKKRSVPRHYE